MLLDWEYPHWMMVVGAILVVVGFVGLAFRQNRNGPVNESSRAWEFTPNRAAKGYAESASASAGEQRNTRENDCAVRPTGPAACLFGSKRSEGCNSLSRRFSCVRLARHPKPIFTRLAAFEDRPSKCHRASDIAIFINEPNPTEAQRNRRFFNSLPFAGTRFNGPPKSLEQHALASLVFPHSIVIAKIQPSSGRLHAPPVR